MNEGVREGEGEREAGKEGNEGESGGGREGNTNVLEGITQCMPCTSL